MEEIKKLYDSIIEGLETPEDMILKLNDLLSVYLLLATKIFEVQKDNEKRIVIIDSIKAMNNNMITKLSKLISEVEMKTIENDDRRN